MAAKTGTGAGDILYGGGPDVLIGLGGDDTYVVYSQADTIVERPGEGRDTVLTFADYTLGAGVSIETLSTAINADTMAIALKGNDLAQVVVGNFGVNLLDGGGGGDTLIGLAGNDTYRVYGNGDAVIENPDSGFDTVLAGGDFVLASGSSIEIFQAADAMATTPLFLGGNELAQRIVGNNGANILNSGGAADTLQGLAGDDSYRVFGQGEEIIESTGQGNDSVFTSASFSLQRSFSVEYLSTAVQAGTEAINLIGNGQAQVIVGNYGDNIIDGLNGADTLIGLVGNDTYRVYGIGDVVVETAGQGTDIVYTSGTYVLRQGNSVETLSTAVNIGTTAINLVGNEIAQTVVGNYAANLIDGGAGSDTLFGLAGADVFRFSTALGGANIDTLPDYGTGADIIQLDPAVFNGLSAGTLAAGAIAYGTAAGDADDRIVYDPRTGALSFDADGNGTGAAVQFAILPTGLAAAAIQVTVAATSNAAPVTITSGGTFLVGNAMGPGVSLATEYPDATSFTFTAAQGQSGLTSANLVFGSNSIGTPPIIFGTSLDVGSFDFTQLGTGVSIRPGTDFLTAGGATIIARPPATGGSFSPPPSIIIGSGEADYIDRSDARSPGDTSAGTLRGGGGNDVLIGGRVMEGGDGNDRLVGTLASTMTGGAGSDVFALPLSTPTPGSRSLSSPNAIVDFTASIDRIELIANRITDLPIGTLDASRFAVGTAATTADQRIIYDPATGNLFYDANGSAPDNAGQFAQFAVLPAHLDLTAASFSVIGA